MSTEAKDKDLDREASCYKPRSRFMLSQGAKHEVSGVANFEIKD